MNIGSMFWTVGENWRVSFTDRRHPILQMEFFWTFALTFPDRAAKPQNYLFIPGVVKSQPSP